MSREQGPVFLDRGTYRRRRVGDAARLLPILGAVLLAVPLLWGVAEGMPVPTSYVMIYLFVVWFGLIGIAALVSRRLQGGDEPTDAQKDE